MTLLDIIIAIILLSWVGGYSFNLGGDLIHLLLVLAIIVFIFRVLRVRT